MFNKWHVYSALFDLNFTLFVRQLCFRSESIALNSVTLSDFPHSVTIWVTETLCVFVPEVVVPMFGTAARGDCLVCTSEFVYTYL